MASRNEACLHKDVRAIGADLRSGKIKSRDLAQAFLERIHRFDDRLHSYAHVMRDNALEEADRADRELKAGFDRGPLHGIPIAIKDLIDVAGERTMAGMPLRSGHKATRDATIVERLRTAGAVILGKLAMTEGATILHHPDLDTPDNPWRTGYSSGFSSSGSGVAVAASLCTIALGSDTGGSVRIPSAFNGITGLKTTWGRVSRAGVWPLVETLDTIGPMARSAADAAAMLGVIAGPDPRDPTAAPVRVPDYVSGIGGGVSALTIGVDWKRIDQDCDPAIAAAVRHVAETLAAAGATIRSVTAPAGRASTFSPLLSAGVAEAHRDLYPEHAASYGPAFAAMLDATANLQARDVAAAVNAADRFTGQMNTLLGEVDLLLAPALPYPARVAVELDALLAAGGDEFERFFAYTLPFNISRHPTITFPAGFSDDGLPCAAQLIGSHFAEATLLRAAHSFQSMTDWHVHRPDLG